ncbi:hypothetical protein SuUB36_13830 [Streptococcus uberis]
MGKDELGSYSYLDFSIWCNKEEYCKHYLKYRESKFKRNLATEIRKSPNSEIDEKLRIDKQKYPPVWLAVNKLTFGQMVNLLELMATNKINEISKPFDCNNSELISWLKCLNLVRNICAHNSNIIDFKFTTVPQLKDNWKKILFEYKNGVYSNRIALPLLIILEMMNSINPKYNFTNIMTSFEKLIKDDNTAKYYGFSSIRTFENLKSQKTKKRLRRTRRTR